MRKYPHRIIFRLTEKDFALFGGLLGKVYGVTTWTDLCRYALEVVHQDHEGRNQPLGTTPKDYLSDKPHVLPSQNGHTMPALSDKIDEKEAKKIFRNVAKSTKKVVTKRLAKFKKKLDKGKRVKS